MRKMWIATAFALAALVAMPAAASETTNVMATVHQFVNGFNRGDAKTAVAACAHEAYIIDDFPPHEWHGADACSRWMNEFHADARKNGITDGKVTLGKPRHVKVNGDRAYVVVPANFLYKQKGKEMREMGSTLPSFWKKRPPAGASSRRPGACTSRA